MIDARITGDPLDAAGEFARFLERIAGDGAAASFVGIARPSTANGDAVTAMYLDHHPSLTAQSVKTIAASAGDRFGAREVLAVHRHGLVEPGDPIVLVAASSPHRRAALKAVDYMMDRLKTEAIFWKREDTPGASRWIEPTDTDHAYRARWRDNGN